MKIFSINLLLILFGLKQYKCQAQLEDVEINKKYTALLKANLNETIEPCEDFYEYACGNWYETYESQEYIDMPGYMDYKVDRQFEDILDKLQATRESNQFYDKILRIYEQCNQTEAFILNHFLKIVQEPLQMQWPVFTEDNGTWPNATEFDWLRTIAELRKYGMDGVIIALRLNVRPSNGSHYMLELTQHLNASLPFRTEQIENILMDFGFNISHSHNLTERIIMMDLKLQNLSMVTFINETEELKYSDNFKEYTLKELSELVPQIDWLKYFTIIRQELLVTEKNVEPLENMTVQTFILDPQYYKELTEMLQTQTNETVAYYIMLKFMLYLIEELPYSAWNKCIKYLRGHMPLAMNYLYEEFQFKEKRTATESVLQQVFQNLKQTFQEMVKENYLQLDTDEQDFIVEELQEMRLKIGNIPQNCSQQFVEDYYAGLSINASSDFFQNHLNILLFTQQNDMKILRNNAIPFAKKVHVVNYKSAVSSSPSKIFENAILVPHGYLQMPLFHPKLSMAYQYSLFGLILAHEIIHAYDLFHIIYDARGNYNWLGSTVAQHYWPYIACYARSPNDILSENIADISGLRMAHQTYTKVLQRNNITSPDFDVQQLFFINSVQFLCGNIKYMENVTDSVISYMEHDMHDVRVRNNWGNYEEFSRAFNCGNETSMHPTEKCRLW